MSRALYIPSRPTFASTRGRADLSGAGLVIAAVIFALFAFDVAAAPARVAAAEAASDAALDLVVSVDADAAPTFQVFRGGAPRTWIVELPGVDLVGTQVAHKGDDVLLESAVVEAATRGSAGRILLTFFADDVDFEATTKKKTLQITFHHQGDKAERTALVDAQKSRGAERARVAAVAAEHNGKAAADARRQAELAAQQTRIEQDKARVVAAAVAEKERLAALQKASDDERARIAAQKKLDDSAAAERARLAAIELQKIEQRRRDEAAALQKKADDERARLAALELAKKKKADDDAARIAAAQKLEAQKALEQQQIAAKKKADDDARLAAAAQKKLDDEKAAAALADQQRIAAAKKKADDDRLAKEQARLAAVQAEKARIAAVAEQQRLAAIAAQKKADDDKRLEKELEQQRLATIERQRQQDILAKEQARITALAEQRRRDDELAEQQRVAAIATQKAAQKKADDERAEQIRAEAIRIEAQRAEVIRAEAQRAEAERRRLAAAPADDAGFGGRQAMPTPVKVAPPTTPTTPTPTPTTTTTTTPARVEAFGGGGGFGGGGIEAGRTVELSRGGGNRYERVALPREAGSGDDWGGADSDDDDNDIDEGVGRSVLSQVTVQRMGNGARVGVRVDGGARYNVARRGNNRLVLTLVDTRAENLDVRRVLDARGLGSAVVRVLPSVEEDSRFRIELVVETRGPVPVRVEQDGQMLWLEVLG